MVCVFSHFCLTKRLLTLIFFLLTGLSLFAQTFRETKIYIPPIEGSGSMEDNAFFYKQLAYEVVLQYNSLVRSRYESDFMLKGTIEPYTGEEQPIIEEQDISNDGDTAVSPSGPVPPRPIPSIRNTYGRREFFSWEVDGEILFYDTTDEDNQRPETEQTYSHIEGSETNNRNPSQTQNEYAFLLELVKTSTGEVIGKQYLIYSTVDASVGELISVIVYYMLTGIPDIIEVDDRRDNWLFINVGVVWAPRIYTGWDTQLNLLNFGLAVQAEYHFLDFMSVELGLQLVPDRVVSSARKEYRDLLLEIPVSLKAALKPLDNLMLEPYVGASLNLSLMGTTKPSLFSWFLGFQFGIRAGPGIFTIDPRFSMDFGKSLISESLAEYQRYTIQLGFGYKFGFLPKTPNMRYY